jgi:ActR/RegA family two-component response regulator
MNRRRTPAAFNLALAFLGAPNVDDVRLKRIIDRHIDRVLGATDGNLSLAADLLGMHRRSLQRYQRRRVRKRSAR